MKPRKTKLVVGKLSYQELSDKVRALEKNLFGLKVAAQAALRTGSIYDTDQVTGETPHSLFLRALAIREVK